MASVWIYLALCFASLLGGALLSWIIYFLVVQTQDYLKIKRKLPLKDKATIGEYIRKNESFFLSRNHVPIDTKEAEENDRRKLEKYREFEKLRRIANGDKVTKRNDSIVPADARTPERSVLSDANPPNKTTRDRPFAGVKRTIRIDE